MHSTLPHHHSGQTQSKERILVWLCILDLIFFGDLWSCRHRAKIMWPFWVAHCWVWLKYSLIKDPKNSPESSRTFEICQKKDLYLLYVCMCVVEKACSYYVVRSKLIFIGNILTKRPVWRSHFHYGSSRTSWVELDQQKNVWENIRVALAKTQARMGWCVYVVELIELWLCLCS